MRFDDRQQEMLSTTLDSLLCYINDRFHIVRKTEGDRESERQLKSQLIERFLWEHRELIGEFVSDNPDGLSQSCLELATGLEGTLYGTLYLESRSPEGALLLHHTGVYAVASPNASFFQQFPEGILELRGAIAPFHDIIVPIPPFAVMGCVSSRQLSHLHEDLARQGTARPIRDARTLARRVRAWREAAAAQEPSSSPAPGVAARGFHRGCLSGISHDKRAEAIASHANQLAREAGTHERILDTLSLEADELPTTLGDALMLLDDDWIADIALDVAADDEPPSAPSQVLAHWIEQRVYQRSEDLNLALTWCSDEQFDLVERLLQCSPLPLGQLSPTSACRLHPMIPYTFILKRDEQTLAWMPPEVRSALSRIDLPSIRSIRMRLREVRMAGRALATMCGIISISDAYERYRRAVSKPLTRAQFESALEEFESSDSRDDYALWRHRGRDYVISVEISDASALARVTREHYVDQVLDAGKATGTPEDPIILGIGADDEDEFLRLVSEKERELERMRVSLLEHDRPTLAPELPRRMLCEGPVTALMELDALRALRAFVDAHIPDDQDDYEFADLFCRSVIVSAVLMCEDYNETMDIIRLYHMQGCEGGDYSDTLGRLVTNAYNALPRWDLNGWSLEQNTERFTGRRRFFNPDGTERRMGSSEPCPCGSGKPYGHCCGRLC